MIQILNTLSGKKEIFKPLEEGKVKMYVCGPTVYNYIHIGNARSAVAFDTVRRYFEYRGYEVDYVSNFTDVDDKIIKAGHEMKMTVKEVTDKFIAAFYEDIDALNIKRATLNPRVMDTMDDIIKFIQVLIDKGYAISQKATFIIGRASLKTMVSFPASPSTILNKGQANAWLILTRAKKKHASNGRYRVHRLFRGEASLLLICHLCMSILCTGRKSRRRQRAPATLSAVPACSSTRRRQGNIRKRK